MPKLKSIREMNTKELQAVFTEAEVNLKNAEADLHNARAEKCRAKAEKYKAEAEYLKTNTKANELLHQELKKQGKK